MRKDFNSKGFGLVGVLIVVVVLAVVGGTGAYVYHWEHKAKNTTSTSSSSSKNSTQGSKNSTSNTAMKTDPYAGWKTYTDTTYHYSFKYPADWTLATNSSQGTSASVRNPGNSVLVSYANPFIKDSGTDSFYAADVEAVTSSAALKIVGGAFTANNLPSYWVVDGSALNAHPLTVGQTSTFETAGRFSDQGSGNDAQLTAYPVGAVFTNTDQVKAWFTGADAKTSLLILQSLTYQQ